MTATFPASWSTTLKWTSGIVTAILVGVSVPVLRGPTPWLALLFVAILAGAVPFVVRGYSVEGRTLLIRRLWWNTRVDLTELKSADMLDRRDFCGTWRLCGNGGLFSFTGWYRNKALGTFRLFANSFHRPVVLRLASRTVVVSPDDPDAFLRALPGRTG